MESGVALRLKEVYKAFRNGDFVLAEEMAGSALELDFEDVEIQAAMKTSIYWKERKVKAEELGDPVSRADFLIKEFHGFKSRFFPRLGSSFEEGLFNLKSWLFGYCLNFYVSLLDSSEPDNTELLLKAGRCQKNLGEFEKAIQFFEKSLAVFRDDAAVLAELADCYDQLSETKMAKVLFREAFFIDPQKVDPAGLQSAMIGKIVESLAERQFSEPVLREWIPVYGNIQGLFNVKREMRPLEVGQLKQSIFSLKNELQEKRTNSDLLVPRLLNRYLWLIDYLVASKEDRARIDEVLLNVKLLDPGVHSMIIN